MAAADAAAQRHQQLKNEANKMAMKIPFFHGDDKEDALDIKEFIRRFKNSANAMGLANNAEKCNMFGNYYNALQLRNKVITVNTVCYSIFL